MQHNYTRIPVPIETENDRRELVSILAAAGLEVRIVLVRIGGEKSPRKRFVEYREQRKETE